MDSLKSCVTNGCFETVEQATTDIIWQMGTEYRELREWGQSQATQPREQMKIEPMCRTLVASGVVVDCNGGSVVAPESLDIYGEDMDYVGQMFQGVSILHRNLIIEIGDNLRGF